LIDFKKGGPQMTNRLNALRLEKDKSIRDVSNDLDINQTGVWKMEVGKQDPSAKLLFDLADLFGCSIDYLTYRSDQKKSPPKRTGFKLH
jgi:DNA-binding XRE family transcriptional regulator